MRAQSIRLFRGAALILGLAPALAAAQAVNGNNSGSDSSRTRLRAVTITATRQKTDVHDVPSPVSVVDAIAIAEKTANTASDLLRELPGVDVIGSGANQARPSIRGQRGQRILLLQDGLRLNNSRRQQDFGELPALVDVAMIDRVEVVRGPSSVLYGTDAIGGVINLITRAPSFEGTPGVGARVAYRYGSAGAQSKTEALVNGRTGGWAFELAGSARVAGNYQAPAGSFGNITLKNNTTLIDGGVRDRNARAYLGWRGKGGTGAFAKVEQYAADDAGFGYIPPELLGGDQTKIQILYPHQEFQKLTLGYSASRLALPVADKLDLTAYASGNKRNLAQNIFAPFGPGTPPGAGVDIRTRNFTDLGSVGFRAEATKVLARDVITYGADFFRDQSANTDSSQTTVIGFGPPTPRSNTRTQVPNASLQSLGLFLQNDLRLHDQLSVIVGGRLQFVRSEPTATKGRTDPLNSHSNSTGVYAANAIWRATPALSVVATVGRGFRSPNLVERYFDGPTPEGSAYQSAAPDLKPEQSVNLDGGLKYRVGRLNAEAFLFENNITDAIQTQATGVKVGTLPGYTNVNIGKLRTRGAEAAVDVLLDAGFSLGANWATITSKNILNPTVPVADTYANKLNLSLGWRQQNGRFWGEYVIRRNGEQKDIQVGTSPVGNSLPAFTVHTVRAGLRGWAIGSVRQDLSLTINNLGNTLYAEAANSSFFRPEPGRTLILGLATTF